MFLCEIMYETHKSRLFLFLAVSVDFSFSKYLKIGKTIIFNLSKLSGFFFVAFGLSV